MGLHRSGNRPRARLRSLLITSQGLPGHAGRSLPSPQSTSIITGEIMSTVHAPISTEIKIRFPVEMLKGIELWASERQLPRSKAIRELIFRGMAKPETAPPRRFAWLPMR